MEGGREDVYNCVLFWDFMVVTAFLVVLAFRSFQLSSRSAFSMVTALKNKFKKETRNVQNNVPHTLVPICYELPIHFAVTSGNGIDFFIQKRHVQMAIKPTPPRSEITSKYLSSSWLDSPRWSLYGLGEGGGGAQIWGQLEDLRFYHMINFAFFTLAWKASVFRSYGLPPELSSNLYGTVPNSNGQYTAFLSATYHPPLPLPSPHSRYIPFPPPPPCPQRTEDRAFTGEDKGHQSDSRPLTPRVTEPSVRIVNFLYDNRTVQGQERVLVP